MQISPIPHAKNHNHILYLAIEYLAFMARLLSATSLFIVHIFLLSSVSAHLIVSFLRNHFSAISQAANFPKLNLPMFSLPYQQYQPKFDLSNLFLALHESTGSSVPVFLCTTTATSRDMVQPHSQMEIKVDLWPLAFPRWRVSMRQNAKMDIRALLSLLQRLKRYYEALNIFENDAS